MPCYIQHASETGHLAFPYALANISDLPNTPKFTEYINRKEK